ncbi:MAG: hypothetical protein WA421_03150, partial [Nitrososphaeraceae archaeon]
PFILAYPSTNLSCSVVKQTGIVLFSQSSIIKHLTYNVIILSLSKEFLLRKCMSIIVSHVIINLMKQEAINP